MRYWGIQGPSWPLALCHQNDANLKTNKQNFKKYKGKKTDTQPVKRRARYAEWNRLGTGHVQYSLHWQSCEQKTHLIAHFILFKKNIWMLTAEATVFLVLQNSQSWMSWIHQHPASHQRGDPHLLYLLCFSCQLALRASPFPLIPSYSLYFLLRVMCVMDLK